METETIHQIVRRTTDNFINGTTKKSKYVEISIYEILQTIDAYLNSKHISGLTDSLGREKPFFNIVTAAVNIWYRATDIDRKNIRFAPKNYRQTIPAFIATVLLQDWMDRVNFAKFLNSWGRALAQYGSSIVEFIERNGELLASVVPFSKAVIDPIDFDAVPRIKKFYKSAAQLKNMATPGHPDYANYDTDAVERLVSSSGGARETVEGQQRDNLDGFFEIYEVHGYLSLATYKKAKGEDPEDGDEKEFFQQIHVVSSLEAGKDEKNNVTYDDYTLYCGKEKEDPYMITHLIEEDDRTVAIGAVEYLFDAQWMQNHTIKQWKDQLDLASKLIFQTADGNYINRNVLNYIETGDIMVHADNKPLTLINNQGHDYASLQGFSNIWKLLGQEITSTPDSLRGNTMPSGTPYRLGAILQEQAGSLFELMTENKGIQLEEMLRKFVIPHLKKKIKGNKDEIVAILDAAGIKQIDSLYIPEEAIRRYNDRAIGEVLGGSFGSIPSPFMPEAEAQKISEELGKLGNQRFFKPDELDQKAWDEIIDDDVWENLMVEITNENKDKNAVLTTLSSMLATFAKADPAFANLLRNRIAAETGVVSPLELANLPAPGAAPPAGMGGLTANANLQ